MRDIYGLVTPYVGVELFGLLLLINFPIIVLYLPRLFFG